MVSKKFEWYSVQLSSPSHFFAKFLSVPVISFLFKFSSPISECGESYEKCETQRCQKLKSAREGGSSSSDAAAMGGAPEKPLM